MRNEGKKGIRVHRACGQSDLTSRVPNGASRSPLPRLFFPAALVAVFAAALVLAACHKNTVGNDGGATGTPAASWGVMKKGSVIVNGKTFDIAGALIIHDDSPSSETLLQDGMYVKVKGRINADGTTGAAEKIMSECEVQGTITAKGADSITVLGQQIFVDSRTVFAGIAKYPALALGQWVEVHGLWDQQDRLLATRIERRTSVGPPIDRINGIAQAPFTGGTPPALSFALRGLTVVTTPGTLIQPAGATVNPGDPVEVHGFLSGTTLSAGRIDRQDLEEAEFEPQENGEYECEGLITNFKGLAADFTMYEATVHLTDTTKFEGGRAAGLMNNVRVKVEGRSTGTVIIADTIKFVDTVRIEANADTAGGPDVLGQAVVVSGRTDLNNLAQGVSGIVKGQGLKIEGFANPDGGLTATRIEGLSNPVDVTKILLQGVVTAVNVSARTISVLGIPLDVTGAGGVEIDGRVVSLDEFFAQVTVNRTIVRARGTFSAGPPSLLTALKMYVE